MYLWCLGQASYFFISYIPPLPIQLLSNLHGRVGEAISAGLQALFSLWGALTNIWRFESTVGCYIFVYWYGSKYSISHIWLNQSWKNSCIPLPSTYYPYALFSSVQLSLSVMSNSVTPWTETCHASLSITNSWSLPKLMSIESVMPSNHVILCRPLLLLPSIFPTQQQGLFKWVSSLHLMAKVLEFQLQHQDCSPLGWTSWISLQSKVVSSLLQHHSSKGSIPRCSDFFIVQLSHPYMTTGKTIALTRWIFVEK